jgi:hypothetical protein
MAKTVTRYPLDSLDAPVRAECEKRFAAMTGHAWPIAKGELLLARIGGDASYFVSAFEEEKAKFESAIHAAVDAISDEGMRKAAARAMARPLAQMSRYADIEPPHKPASDVARLCQLIDHDRWREELGVGVSVAKPTDLELAHIAILTLGVGWCEPGKKRSKYPEVKTKGSRATDITDMARLEIKTKRRPPGSGWKTSKNAFLSRFAERMRPTLIKLGIIAE